MSTVLLAKGKAVRLHIACNKCGDMAIDAHSPLDVAKNLNDYISCDKCEVQIEEDRLCLTT